MSNLPDNQATIRIAISYRHQDDTVGDARVLQRVLREHFGPGNVFLDFDTIPPGTDWMEEITKTIGSFDVLLPLIGRHWLNVTDERGRRRIEDEEEVLRYEIRSALERGLRIVPLTFHGAKMPMRDELPEDIARLTRYQAIAIENEHWDEDVQTLVGTLERMRQEISAQRPGAEGAEGIRAEPRRAEAEKTLRDEVADLAPTGGRADQALLPAPPPVETREPEGERSAWTGWFGSTAPGATEEEQRKRKRWQLGGYIAAGLVLVLAAVPSEEPDEGAAYEIGAFLGGLGVSLAIAFAIRLAYVKLIRRDGRPIWSPWIVAMAAVIAVAANA